MVRASWKVALPAGVLALAALSGCSTHPGQAAVVGSTSISTAELDDFAETLCAAQAAGQGSQQPQQPIASKPARQGALDILINTELSQRYGAAVGAEADEEQVAAAMQANQATADQLSGRQAEVFGDALRAYVEGQLMLIDAGRKSLEDNGASAAQAGDEQALAEGTKLRDAWAAKNADVDVDPRFGDFEDGSLAPSDGSVSVPVSSAAKAGAAAQPSTDYVASLPASQKCG